MLKSLKLLFIKIEFLFNIKMSVIKEFCKKYINIINELKEEGIINEREVNLLKQRSSIICTLNVNEDGKIANIDQFLQNIDKYDTNKVRDYFKNNIK